MKTLVVILAMATGMVGCEQKSETPTPSPQSINAPADNTQKNERDRTADTLTPIDQGNSETDRSITQTIRKGVMSDDSLSMTAKNVKIITIDGVVTLRGPVQNAQEKTAIVAMAQQADNVKRVDNQLELTNP